jgi:hypothetical protein
MDKMLGFVTIQVDILHTLFFVTFKKVSLFDAVCPVYVTFRMLGVGSGLDSVPLCTALNCTVWCVK